MLAQQASGYEVRRGKFEIKRVLMLCVVVDGRNRLRWDTEQED
jgi:hypothetical protein